MPVAGEDVNGCGDDDLKLDSPNLVLIRRAALPLLEPRRLENGDCWPPSVPVGARRSRKLDLPSPGPSESPLPLPADELPGLSPIFSGANQATARMYHNCFGRSFVMDNNVGSSTQHRQEEELIIYLGGVGTQFLVMADFAMDGPYPLSSSHLVY
uniref:Uncharacterized protein n=1 Tax=Leersia perrieri TaxID=77586 RepID=A0A0D9X5X7_9ORYZ